MSKTARKRNRIAFLGRRKEHRPRANRLSFEPLEVRQMLSLSSVVSPVDVLEPMPDQIVAVEVSDSPESVHLAIAPQQASSPYWRAAEETSTVGPNLRPLVRASRFERLSLNVDSLRAALSRAPLEFTAEAAQAAPVISLPTPDGGFSRFTVVESPIMEPGLAAKFPEIKTYSGQGIDDPTATVRFDLTPAGFHAYVLSLSGDYSVEPYRYLDDSLYASYYQRDSLGEASELACDHESDAVLGHDHADEPTLAYPSENEIQGHTAQAVVANADPLPAIGTELRTYRLAVAATGEYTALWGSVAQTQAAIVTTTNALNGIFGREVAVRLVLVSNNNQLIKTNALTDGYTNGNNSVMMGENQGIVDAIIGDANYDIGHVFGTGGGGWAGIGVVGVTGSKASAASGGQATTLIAHEMGHEFGATHTFNGPGFGGQYTAATAYEPGNGTTIMSYAGQGGVNEVQSFRSSYFHSKSFDQITAYTHSGPGNTAAVITQTGNAVPFVNFGQDYTIPAATPFVLKAEGGDPDLLQSVTYTWEQRDLGPQQALSSPDNGSSPLFRSLSTGGTPQRAIPPLSNLLAGTMPLGEQLPTTNRNLNFRVTVRDNQATGGGVNFDEMKVTVVNTGTPFGIVGPASTATWAGGTSQQVTWNVAGTNAAPINTGWVDIRLSLDGGYSFPVVLATNTPNDGSQTITVPNVDTTRARIQVKAVGNIFYDVSDANFSIEAVPEDFVLRGIDMNGNLYEVDQHTGVATNSIWGDINRTVGIALRPEDGLFYTLIETGATRGTGNSLYTIDPVTGDATRIGPTGLTDGFIEGDLDFDPTTGMLYGLYTGGPFGSPKRELFTIDVKTGEASVVATINWPSDMSGMAFDPLGNLYVLDNGLQSIFKVDKHTGAISSQHTLSGGLGEFAGMDFHPETGTLFVADGGVGGSDSLYTLNPATGTLTWIGPTGLANGLSGLEFFGSGEIRGVKWNDLNGNGTRDTGEPGLADWTIYVDENNNRRYDSNDFDPDDYDEAAVLNNASSNVAFSRVGDPMLYVTARTDSLASTGTKVFAAGGNVAWNQDRRLRMDLSDPVSMVSIDFIADSSSDVGVLYVYNASGQLLDTYSTAVLGTGAVETMTVYRPQADIDHAVAHGDGTRTGRLDNLVFGEISTTTDSDGRYRFVNLPSNTYTIAEVKQTDWVQTSPGGQRVVWDEAVDGDLSNDKNQPTRLNLAYGNNVVTGAVGTGSEDDFFSFTVPEGMNLAKIRLLDYSSSSNTTFFGIDDSPIYNTTDPPFGRATIGAASVGTNILPAMGTSLGNFTPPLPAGTYSFWLDENGTRESYGLEFELSGGGGRGSHSVVVAPGDSHANVNFGNWQPPNEIHGVQWNDFDGDGVRDAGEPGLANWTIYLDENENGQLDQTALEPDDYDAGSPVDNVLPEVTLSAIGSAVTTSQIIARVDALASTGNNVFANQTYNTWSSSRQLRVDFSSPVSMVAIDFIADDSSDFGLLEVYGADGMRLDTYLTADLATGEVETMFVSRPEAEITHVIASGYSGQTGLLDNLVFGEASTITDSSGEYRLVDLAPGTYRVNDVQQPDWLPTYPVTPNGYQATVRGGHVYSNKNFGNWQPGEIRGTKFNDRNGDGLRGPGEEGLPGWQIFLDHNYDGVLDPVTRIGRTGPAGDVPDVGPLVSELTLSGLVGPIVDMNVNVSIAHPNPVLLDAYLVSPAGTRVDLFSPGLGVSGVTSYDDEGVRPEGMLSAFDGEDPNGTWRLFVTDVLNDGLAGTLSGWALNFDYGELAATTDANGEYVFDNLGSDIYVLAEVQQPGWEQTAPGSGFHVVALAPGQSRSGFDFGSWQPPAEIHGSKFNDLNGDGLWDQAEEPGLAGWTIYLDSNGNGQLNAGETSTTTDADGNYSFADLAAQTYTVAEVFQTGWVQTAPAAGFYTVTLSSGQVLTDQDFGAWEAGGDLVGVDFDTPGGSSPIHWTQFNGGPVPVLLSNLTDESGATTPIDLSISASDGLLDQDFGKPAPGELPMHTQSLARVDGNLYDQSGVTLTWGDLTPFAPYEVYVFGLDTYTDTQNVTISGDGPPIAFTQTFTANQLWVNRELGDSSRNLDSFAELVNASQNGTITIDVTAVNEYLALGGVAIRPAEMLWDFGDAPEPNYPTRLANNGARHEVSDVYYLGGAPDADPDGQSDATASGDDAGGSDDEDGVFFPSLFLAGFEASVDVMASADGKLNAWFDFNGNGSWADPGEQIFVDRDLTAGLNSLSFPVPATAQAGGTFARFRFNADGGVSFDGFGGEGEVEDYMLHVRQTIDLVGEVFDVVQEPLTAGATFDTKLMIGNHGPHDSGAFRVDYYLSTDGVITTADRLLGGHNLAGVPGNGSSDVIARQFTLPPASDPFWSTLGSANYTIGVIIDAGSAVAEFDETNNSNRGDSIDLDGVPVDVFSGKVVGRHIFYNNSAFDGKDPSANAQDDAAIATDKQVLLPGETATFANYTSYARGINGIMLDVQGLADPNLVQNNDFSAFTFKVGNSDDPTQWQPAPDPVVGNVRDLGGGVHRVTLIWDDNAIPNKHWLQVTVKKGDSTGLDADDVFYVGNSIGEATGDFRVDYSDAFDVIWPLLSTPLPIGPDHPADINRDGRIDYSDVFDSLWPNLSGPAPLAPITPPATPAAQLQATDLILDGNLPWVIELARFNASHRSSRDPDEGDPLEATAVDRVFAVYAVE
jgi:subtilisin-like proprotein convertase family protein